MQVIAMANQKGGVAKSTTATALCEALAERGRNVLLIDTDPQCNATATYGAQTQGMVTLYDVLTDGAPLADAVQHTALGDIVPCDPLLSGADAQLVKLGKEHLLRRSLEPVKESYDVCLIDTTPSLGILLINALTAADEALIPITADAYSLDGLAALLDTVAQVREYTNPKLGTPFLFLTRWQGRTRIAKEYADTLPQTAREFGANMLPVRVRECVKVRAAQKAQSGLLHYAPHCVAAEDYRELADALTGGVLHG